MKQELCQSEKNKQKIELDEEQEKNPYRTLLAQDIEEEE